MITARIPLDFINRHASISWTDVAYALDHQLTSPNVAIELARQRIAARQSTASSEDETRLAASSPSDPVRSIVGRLASHDHESEPSSSQSKWLYLLLRWLFENRSAFEHPLQTVEEIYADFEYPEEISKFVRYMPMTGPDLGSTELNEARLYEYWSEYLESAGRRFRKG